MDRARIEALETEVQRLSQRLALERELGKKKVRASASQGGRQGPHTQLGSHDYDEPLAVAKVPDKVVGG